MQNFNLAICTQSFTINSGLYFIFSKIKGVKIVLATTNTTDLESEIVKTNIDIVLVSDFLLHQNDKLQKLYKTNKKVKWALFNTENLILNPLFDFEMSLLLSDTETELLNKINTFIEKEIKQSDNEYIKSELTDREKEILKNVAQGFTNAEIADKLFISQHTVIAHRKKITFKLGIKTISGLTVYALINSLIDIKDVNNLK